MLANAWSRSWSETPFTWSNRATALRTWLASVSGSLRLPGKAYTLSGRSSRAVLDSSPCFSCGFHVVFIPHVFPLVRFPHPGDVPLREDRPERDRPGEYHEQHPYQRKAQLHGDLEGEHHVQHVQVPVPDAQHGCRPLDAAQHVHRDRHETQREEM